MAEDPMTPPGTYPIGYTRRSNVPEGGPVRHAYTTVFASRTGQLKRAVCGTAVYRTNSPERFDPTHPRACPRCAKATR